MSRRKSCLSIRQRTPLRLRIAATDVPVGTATEFDAVPDSTAAFFKAGHAVALTAFAPGETVEARLTWRTSPDRIVVIRELYDVASFAARQNETKVPLAGTVAQFSETELDVHGTDGALHRFRVSDKTRLFRADTAAYLSDFPVGAPVAVKSRRLPSGDLAASIVAPDADQVTRVYHDTLAIWNGVVAGIQGNEQTGATVMLRRDDGAARRFFLLAGAHFAQGRVTLPWSSLPNATVRVHLVRGAMPGGLRASDLVRIAATRKTLVSSQEGTSIVSGFAAP